MAKRALITGISGQDGGFLAKLLLAQGYSVFGTARSYNQDFWRLKYLGIEDQVDIRTCDPVDVLSLIRVISETKPNEIYNLAAQSSVSLSFSEPANTISSNVQSLINILETVRVVDDSIRVYQASSSEMFGNTISLPLKETSPFNPVSPYGISKVACHWIIKNYRESFGLFACSGILFNHESILRSPHFFVKKVVNAAAEVANGTKSFIELGNLDIARDFGCAEKYVEAMWLILQQETPKDFLICSGRAIKLREIVAYVLEQYGLGWDAIKTNPKFIRPSEIEEIYGDSSKAKAELGWAYTDDFFEVVQKLIDYQRQNKN